MIISGELKLTKKYNEYYKNYFDKECKNLSYEKICDNIYDYYDCLDDKDLSYMKKKINSKKNTILNKDSSNASITLINIIFTFFITYIIFLYGMQVQGFYNNYNVISNNTYKIQENNTELNTIEFDINKENDINQKEKLKFRKQGLIDENKILQKQKDTLTSVNKTNFESVQEVTSSVKKNILFWLIGYAMLLIIVVYFFKVKTEQEYNYRRSFFMLCLEIIEDIEENRIKKNKRLEQEVFRKELIEQIKQHIDDNNVIKNTILPTMIEIAATSVIKKGIFSKLINKFRKT